MMNFVHRHLSLLPIVFAMLLFCGRTAQTTVTTCEIRSIALVNSFQQEAQAPTPLYMNLLRVWQASFKSSVEAGRFLSLFLGLLTLACLYRLAADLWGPSYARWTILLAGTAEVTVRLWGWASIYSWAGLLALLTTWLLWRATQTNQRRTTFWY